MKMPRLSPRQQAALCVALALLLWAPQGISSETSPIVTGHSTFYNGNHYDPCLASVAGIVRSRVMWFNNQVLVERYPGKGTFVYITESGGVDPTDNSRSLYSEGVSYNFVDPNGAPWHVEEAFMNLETDFHLPGDPKQIVHTGNGGPGSPDQNDSVGVNAGLVQKRQYVWIVELAAQPIYDQFPGSDQHSYYNFLDLVDTCKFHNSTVTYRETINHTGNEAGHVADGPKPHTHDVWNADIYLGAPPQITPLGLDTSGALYQTEWATSGNPSNGAGAMQNNPQGAYDQAVPDT